MNSISTRSPLQPNREPRTTRQRTAIGSLLDDIGDFRSAQQIHALLRTRGQTIGLATVYRTLTLMADNGEIDALMRSDGETQYRRCSTEHHHHLVCRSCGLTIEIAGPAVESWARKVADTNGFVEVSHTVEVFGICAACALTSEAPH